MKGYARIAAAVPAAAVADVQANACEDALLSLAEAGKALEPVALVGLPVRFNHGLYNCAAVLHQGSVLGIVPKAYLPNYREFEEARWYRSGFDIDNNAMLDIGQHQIPFGVDLLFKSSLSNLTVGLEICEDLQQFSSVCRRNGHL